MPTHNHGIRMTWGDSTGNVILSNGNDRRLSVDQGAKTFDVGGGKAHQNMPPYTTIYMWRRSA